MRTVLVEKQMAGMRCVALMAQISLALMMLCVWTSFAGSAGAHEQRPAIATLQINDNSSFTLSISTNLEALIAEIGAEHDDTSDSPNVGRYEKLRQLEPPMLEQQFRAFFPEWVRGVRVDFEGRIAPLSLQNLSIPEVGDLELARLSDVVLSGTIPKGTSTVQWEYDQQYGASIVRVVRSDTELQSQFVLAGSRSEIFDIVSAQNSGFWTVFRNYVYVGYVHIIPEGLDHILFVLGLFLLSAKWRPLLAQVTLFTLAHSVTLGLGLYGIVRLSPNIVEPLIALSIVYVAIENVLTERLRAWRSVLVFAFGLLHGLGFAGILLEIGMDRSQFVLGLIAFNIGVELGQLSVIAIALVCVWAFLNKPWYRQYITIPSSLAIASVGVWWFVERTFL